MKILAVDDDDLFRELLLSGLAENGILDVTCANAGEEALELISTQEKPFDCFLLDVTMPGMDGIDLCRKIRKNPDYRLAPIIMITSSDARKFMQPAFEAGATDYLKKPLDIVDLKARINVAMLLVETTSREAESRQALRSLLKLSKDHEEFEPGVRITFADVDQMRDYFQLENKLLRMGEGVFAMSLFSVQIRDFNALCKSANPSEMYSVLRAISVVLTWAIPSGRFIFSYVGYGKFVGLTLMRNPVVAPLLQAKLRDRIAPVLDDFETVTADNVVLDVNSLSTRRLMAIEEALKILRTEIRSMGSVTDTPSPPLGRQRNRASQM